MSDLSITVANVKKTSTTRVKHGVAGATITAGIPLYKHPTTEKLHPLDVDVASAEDLEYVGLAVHAALTDQPVEYAHDGDLDIGATIVEGKLYVGSGNAGGIAPVDDLATGDAVFLIGIGSATAGRIKLKTWSPGVTL